MHAAERRLLDKLREGAGYERHSDTWSEALWLHRFCGPPEEVVLHFERWQACVARLEPLWARIFDPREGLDYPAFEPAAITGGRP